MCCPRTVLLPPLQLLPEHSHPQPQLLKQSQNEENPSLEPSHPASLSLCVAASFGLGVHKVVSLLFSLCTHAGP